MTTSIVDVLELKALREPSFRSWTEALESFEDLFEIRLSRDVVEEAEQHLSSFQEKLECDVCNSNVRRFESVFYADVDFGPQLGLNKIRWFRLCEACGAKAIAQDDLRIIFMFRQWPETDLQWRNGWVNGYALEGEPPLKLNP